MQSIYNDIIKYINRKICREHIIMNKISETNKPIQFFKNPILNSLSHTSLSTVIIIYTPVVFYFLYQSFHHFSVIVILLASMLGLLIWSFIEYITHRFAFHFKFINERIKYFHSIFHLAHHQYPHDKTKYQALLLITLPYSILYYFTLKVVFDTLSEPIFVGFILGYIIYEYTHFSTHQLKMQNAITKIIKQHHMRHHYFNNKKNFGVTSPLWDFVFNTYLNPNEMRESVKDKND